MSPKFGTSGLRGLVSELTDELIADYTRAFLATCDTGRSICLGRDLRPSSAPLLKTVSKAAQAAGIDVIDCGAVPTPALALAAAKANAGAIMITGSHIPADRNGLKFYLAGGLEITKIDERAIIAQLGKNIAPSAGTGAYQVASDSASSFVNRYISAFGSNALSNRHIGLYEHSAVGRDALHAILTGLGARVTPLGRSEHFIPIDTEAVGAETRKQIAAWIKAHGLDALVSTDGDSDRPLLADETGRVVAGDILGQITAQYLGAQTVVTPISSNSGVLQKGFGTVIRTRIGSPYVIAGMVGRDRVVGYEANGGFLLGFTAKAPAGPLTPLLTRDCMLPLIAVLAASAGVPVSVRLAQEPTVITLADRLQKVSPAQSQTLMTSLIENTAARAAFLAPFGKQAGAPDLTDGLRMTLTGGAILHIRPSGNAPELRLYVEEKNRDRAEELLQAGLARLRETLNNIADGVPKM